MKWRIAVSRQTTVEPVAKVQGRIGACAKRRTDNKFPFLLLAGRGPYSVTT